MICLDTNAIIAVLKGRPDSVRARLAEALERGETVAISAIVLFELWYGVVKSARTAENTERLAVLLGKLAVLPFDEADAASAGQVRAELERAGTPIGPFDVLIAGQALRRGATLITANASEFARVRGLTSLDWS